MTENAAQIQSLNISRADKQYLKDIVHWSITTRLTQNAALDESTVPEPDNPIFKKELGAFITLLKGGDLRGCIGNVVGTRPLYLTIAHMARAAAFEDPRFPPITSEEYGAVSVEISILSPLTLCPNPELIEVGRHGLLIQSGAYSGILLPQVPVEWHWNRTQFLEQTCIKAGLHHEMWKKPETKIYWFEAYVF